MRNLFQNKFMIVLIVIAILLVGTTSFISALGYASYVRNAIGIVLTPVQRGASYVFDSVGNIFSKNTDYEALKEENEKLKEELESQKELVVQAELAVAENEKLKDFLGLKEEHTDFELADALVTGSSSGNYETVFTLNRGSLHGVEPGMAVVDKYGVVGCISEVGLTWSKATPLIETERAAGVYVERTGNIGVACGTFSTRSEGLCVVSYLPEDTDVKAGDRIFTSGEGGFYPGGLLVGTVEYAKKDPISRETKAYVRPAADLNNLKRVMIITDYEKTYE